MIRKLIVFLLISASAWSQTTKNVYFIGNSYTESYNIPQLVAQIATTTNDVLTFQKTTPGGTTLMQHSQNANVETIIANGHWDYVVLQEQSQIPSLPDSWVTTQMYPAVATLVQKIKQYNPCATPMFYMTWGRKNGDAQFCPTVPYVCTYEGMDHKIRERYEYLATTHHGVLSPVGAVWHYIRENHPEIELYSSDESHPSALGAMAAAYTFYTVIFRKDPTLATFTNQIDPNQISTIRNAVKTVVYDHFSTWGSGVNDVPSYFTVEPIAEATFQFNSSSTTATQFFWDFGDGTHSVESNPQHTYTSNGTYEVTLKTNICEDLPPHTETIVVQSLHSANFDNSSIEMYPNPVEDVLNIEFKNQEFVRLDVFNISGSRVKLSHHQSGQNLILHTAFLPKGVYLLKLTTNKANQTFRFVK